MMDDIYNNATVVNVYLGPGNEKTDETIIAVKNLATAAAAAFIAKKRGVAEQATRTQYDKIAEEVLGKSPELSLFAS